MKHCGMNRFAALNRLTPRFYEKKAKNAYNILMKITDFTSKSMKNAENRAFCLKNKLNNYLLIFES